MSAASVATPTTLVIATHVEDHSYGMGGTILKRLAQGHRVFVAAVSVGEVVFEHLGGKVVPGQVREQEFIRVQAAYPCEGRLLGFHQEAALDTVARRDIVGALERVQDEIRADTWYLPAMSFHQDHRSVFEACAAAARPTRRNVPAAIYAYELPLYSWNPPVWRFTPHIYEDITQYLERKIEICTLYTSQYRTGVLDVQHVRDYGRACGSEAGFIAAERFEVIRIRRG